MNFILNDYNNKNFDIHCVESDGWDTFIWLVQFEDHLNTISSHNRNKSQPGRKISTFHPVS